MAVQTQIQVRRGTASSWTSTNPTLAAGEIGFESDTGKIKVGTGSATWNSLTYIGAANAIQYVYNASAGQTTFSGTDANGATLAYTVGAEQVYVNGVLQVRGTDYTATNGTSVVLTTATIASDIVTVIAYGTFTVADTYTQAQANATFPLNTSAFFAGKNKIINGDFGIWQRGTSYALPATSSSYGAADRWYYYNNSITGRTISRQSAGLAGFTYCQRLQRDSGNTNTTGIQAAQMIESSIATSLQGQFVTVSFWARAGANYSVGGSGLAIVLYAGTGTDQNPYTSGYTGQTTPINTTQTITTTWTRYSFTTSAALASTITELTLAIQTNGVFVGTAGAADYFEITGVQLEAGSVATAFQTATGTIQGELAACQRYYQVFNRDNMVATGATISTSAAIAAVQFMMEMRTSPTITLAAAGSGSGQITFLTASGYIPATIGSIGAQNITKYGFRIDATGFTSAFTAGNASLLWANSADVWKASAEL